MKASYFKKAKIIGTLIDYSKRSKKFSFGFYGLLLFLFIGFVLSPLAPFDPRIWGIVPRDRPPSFRYLLGTTSTGQDVFWLLCWSIRNSLIIGFVSGLVVVFLGVFIGLIAGFKGGLIDRIAMLVADIFIVIPDLPIIIMLMFLFHEKASLLFLSGVIALFNWARPLRQIRAQVLSLREREFISTAWFSGRSTLSIVLREILPHLTPWILALVANFSLIAIGSEAGLAVLGLSLTQEATLGMMIYWMLQYNAIFRNIWWWFLPSVLTISLLFLVLFFLYSGITDLITRE